jgi:putative peptide zinc metalloprotease protein
VLVVGDVDVAVPQNLAVAANYECTSCLTYALAVQLFLTVPATLSEDAIASINELWEQIAAYGATITQVPLDEIQDQLTAYEQQVLDIIEADVGPLGGTETPSPTDEPTTTESETPTESSSPSPSETPSETPTPTPSESTTTTLSPTPSPTPSEPPTESPTESPSSTPSPTPTESPSPTTPAPTSTSPTESASPAASPTSGTS